ncbi:MAG: rhomboid family intramembrane serine protease [Candidatus Sumerlaeota bacterium]|nr:rhomboid family intramembrane serine protease [Candidatus Sumerlaeota bacterium]
MIVFLVPVALDGFTPSGQGVKALVRTWGWFSPDDAVRRLQVWRFVSYMFLHANLVHIFFNMFTLCMFGRRLEQRWGAHEFYRFYFVCGVGAAVFQTLLSLPGLVGGTEAVPMVGASGAIYGLLLAYAYYWADDIVYVNFILPMKIKYLVLIFGAINFFGSVGDIAHAGASGIAHFAHLGGLLTGWLYLKGGGWRRWGSFGRRGSPGRRSQPSRRPFFDDDTWR